MISSLRYTLVADGTSDRALLPLIRWTLLQTGIALPLAGSWATPRGPGGTISRIPAAIDDSLCDLLFVHRDAEKQDDVKRYTEIQQAIDALEDPRPTISVVPIRMTEAWLLIDESAIRRAADNPNGKLVLQLPSTKNLENIPDPKAVLDNLLCSACELNGRRLSRFRRDLAKRRIRVADFIEDYSPLRHLPSFQKFEGATRQLLLKEGWL